MSEDRSPGKHEAAGLVARGGVVLPRRPRRGRSAPSGRWPSVPACGTARRLALGVALVLAAASPALAEASNARTMALTFDDLPYVAGRGRETLAGARRATVSILAALAKHDVRATAFVNESRLQVAGEVGDRTDLLRRWVDAGSDLGNHTFAHVDLNDVSAAAFTEEIIKGETTIRKLMGARGSPQLHFRHPYTHTGDTAEKKAEVERFLVDHGYRIAPFTIDSQDHVFNRAYLASKEGGDEDAAQRTGRAYAEFVVQATAFAEAVTDEIFGRRIPQVLLLHANDINADCLGELLGRLQERGYEFVPLDQAMADAAYDTPDTYVTAYGPTWLWRWMKSKGLEVDFRGDPEPPDWVNDLSRRMSRSGAAD